MFSFGILSKKKGPLKGLISFSIFTSPNIAIGEMAEVNAGTLNFCIFSGSLGLINL